MLDVTGRNYFG